MSLFHDIQTSVLKEDVSLASVLLKLRLLNSHLESEPLATWIRQELEGYGADEVPPYRTVGVTYKGTFSSAVSRLENAPIPPALINKFAGEHFTHYKVKDSISAITMLAQTDGTARVDGSNLILLLQGKVYADYRCNDVFGIVSPNDFVGILDVVRSKILDFTIAIQKEHPDIREVDLSREAPESNGGLTADANRIIQQIFYANSVTNVTSFEADMGRILTDRVRRSGSNEDERKRIMDSIKSAGVQEAVKQIVQRAPHLLRLLSTLGQ